MITQPASARLFVDAEGVHQSFEWTEPAGLSSPNGDNIVIDGELYGQKASFTYNWTENDKRQIKLIGKRLDGTMTYDGYTTCPGVNCGTAITHKTDDRIQSAAFYYNPSGKLQNKKAPKNLRYNFGLRYWEWESVFNNAAGQTMDRSYTSIKSGLSYSTNSNHFINYHLFARAGYAFASSVEFNTSEYGYKEDVSFEPGSMSGSLGLGFLFNTPLQPITVNTTYRYRSNQQTSETITTNSGKEQRFVEPKDTTQTLTVAAGFRF